MPQPSQPIHGYSPRGVLFLGDHHLRKADGDWGLPFVFRLMSALAVAPHHEFAAREPDPFNQRS
jgi:hypothetical protein